MAPIVPKNRFLFFLIFVQWIYSPVAAIPFRKNEVYGENTINRNWRPTLTRDRESLPVYENFTSEPSDSDCLTKPLLSYISAAKSQDYQPLCQSINQRVDLHEPDYEFRPPFYHSIECKHTANKLHHRGHQDGSQICLQSGLSCVQRTKTIQLAKRKIGTSCWTLFTKEVHSGCECMWPVQTNGDSKHRFT